MGFITKGTTNEGGSATRSNLRDAISESESLREQQAKASLLQTGVAGVARVTSVVDSGVRINSEPVLDIELEVALEDGRHYETRVRELAPQMYAGRVEPGREHRRARRRARSAAHHARLAARARHLEAVRTPEA